MRALPFSCALGLMVLTGSLLSQGPSSCGYHLDIRANETSTHAAIADMPNPPGHTFGMPPGFPGSPYTAHATPGSPIAMIINANPLAYGPAPVGPGSCGTIIWSVPAPPPAPVLLPAPFVPTCDGSPHIIGILPIGGTLVDSCGLFGPPPPFGFYDLPGGGRYTIFGVYPPFGPVVNFQVAGITPAGAIWITNAVTIMPGPNPAEVPVAAPVACGAFPPGDEGQSVGNPTPPGFLFYGFPAPVVDLDTNGFADFLPGVTPCDFAGASGDLGCAPATVTVTPRVSVNHVDHNFTILPAAPFVPAITMEMRPPGPTWPAAFIYRWKNAPAFASAVGQPGLNTSALALELQDSLCGACPVPMAPFNYRIVAVRSWLGAVAHDLAGVGPGIAGQGFGGPPPVGAPTCALGAAGLAYQGLFGFPAFLGAPIGVIHMDLAASGVALLNNAAVYTPLGPGPTGYMLNVY